MYLSDDLTTELFARERIDLVGAIEKVRESGQKLCFLDQFLEKNFFEELLGDVDRSLFSIVDRLRRGRIPPAPDNLLFNDNKLTKRDSRTLNVIQFCCLNLVGLLATHDDVHPWTLFAERLDLPGTKSVFRRKSSTKRSSCSCGPRP